MTDEYLKFRDKVLHWWNNEQLLNHNKILIKHRIGKTLLSYSEIENLYFLETTKPITMEQTPIQYWYCSKCDCEIDSKNVTFEEKHDNCKTEVETYLNQNHPL